MSGDLFCEPIKGYQPSPGISEIPDIRWRSSIRDLVELLMVLNELGVFSDRENNPITFTRLVGIASNTLGVEIKQPFKIRNESSPGRETKTSSQRGWKEHCAP